MTMLDGGIAVLTDVHCVERRWVRKPKSRRKRIRKKWRKNPRNWISIPRMYAVGDPARGGYVVMHPALEARFRDIRRVYVEARIIL